MYLCYNKSVEKGTTNQINIARISANQKGDLEINTALKIVPPASGVAADNIINVDFRGRRTTDLYKSDGKPKATAADPIRDPHHIHAMQEHFLSNGKIRDYALFTVGICFGIRAGDLLNLRLHHILNDNGTFKTHCDLIEAKTRKFNNPAITPHIQRVLTDYIATLPQPALHYPLWQSRKRNPDGSPRPITLTQCNRILKDAAKAVGVPGHISSHTLRKTFAYQLLKTNPNDDTVKLALQQMLNHNDFKTTLRYCGLAQDAMDKYRGGLEDLLILKNS